MIVHFDCAQNLKDNKNNNNNINYNNNQYYHQHAPFPISSIPSHSLVRLIFNNYFYLI